MRVVNLSWEVLVKPLRIETHALDILDICEKWGGLMTPVLLSQYSPASPGSTCSTFSITSCVDTDTLIGSTNMPWSWESGGTTQFKAHAKHGSRNTSIWIARITRREWNKLLKLRREQVNLFSLRKFLRDKCCEWGKLTPIIREKKYAPCVTTQTLLTQHASVLELVAETVQDRKVKFSDNT